MNKIRVLVVEGLDNEEMKFKDISLTSESNLYEARYLINQEIIKRKKERTKENATKC